MKKFFGIAASATLCIIGGMAQAKNLNAADDNILAIGTAQVASTVSSVAISQPIEGQYSSNVAVGLGSARSITGGTRSITGGTRSITGGTRSITGGTRSITGGTRSITGGTRSITGGTRSITGGTRSITGGTR